MQVEYAVIDDQGQMFGLPANTFTSKEAAESVLTHLEQRHQRLEREANEAQKQLDDGSERGRGDRDRLQADVDRWEDEKQRSYSIIKREVGEWEEAVAK